MINFILIFLCIGIGMILSKKKLVPSDAHKPVNAWLIYAALPSLALRYIPSVDWNFHILISILGPILVWIGAWLFVKIYDRRKKLSAGSHTALLVTCGLGNTAFIGFPMIAAYYGENQIHHAVVFDQITFILFSTVGVITILRTSAEGASKISFGYILKKVFSFPPFIACLTALILPSFVDISFLDPLLDKLLATMSPLALFSIGLQMKLGAFREEWRLISAGLLYKLILAPCLVLGLAFLLHSTGDLAKISVFEAGMSSHITISLLASQYNLDPRYCSLVVGSGILISFVTCTCWYFITGFVF